MKNVRFLMLLAALLLVVCVPVAAQTLSSSVILGDVDQSGALSTMDAREMMHYMAGRRGFSAHERLLADWDGNGRIDTQDVRYLLTTVAFRKPTSTVLTTTTTVVTTTTAKPSLDDDGFYDDIVKP